MDWRIAGEAGAVSFQRVFSSESTATHEREITQLGSLTQMRQEGHGKIQRVSHLNPTNGHGGTVEPGIASPPGSRGHKVELQGKSMPAKGLGPSQKVKGKGAAKKKHENDRYPGYPGYPATRKPSSNVTDLPSWESQTGQALANLDAKGVSRTSFDTSQPRISLEELEPTHIPS